MEVKVFLKFGLAGQADNPDRQVNGLPHLE
jgi:hypothetical protein